MEYFDIDHFFRGTLRICTLSKEVPRYRIEGGTKTSCVAIAVKACHEEDPPEVLNDCDIDQGNEENSRELMESWDQWVTELYDNEVEVYTRA